MKIWVMLGLAAAALVQFLIMYVRALFASIAAQPVSSRIREAANLSAEVPSAGDFRTMLGIYDLTPDLRHSSRRSSSVRYYFAFLKALRSLMPPVAGWAAREMDTCARYVAVRAGQRAERNAAFLHQFGS